MDPLQSRATPWKSGLTTAEYRHRPIVFKALGWKEKMAFMARRNKLRGINVYLNKIREAERTPHHEAERSKENTAYVRYYRVIVHPTGLKIYLFLHHVDVMSC